ncbi:MAG: mannosyltransferase, partial [Bacteroidetes bacterium HGW-Bacteroidetes-12]
MLDLSNNKWTKYLFYSSLSGLSAICYYFFAYKVSRIDFFEIVVLYSVLFVLFFRIYSTQKNNFLVLASTALFFRAIFIVATPTLSQDFYR